MFRNRHFLAAALCLILLSPAALLATSYDHWYQPHYMASVEDANNRLQFLSPHLSPGRVLEDLDLNNLSYSLKNMTVSTLGINFIFTKTGVNEDSEVPFTKEVVSSIVYPDIDYYMVMGPVAHGEPFWCIYPYSHHRSASNVICAPTESEAHQLVDALATLAVASGKDPVTDPGISLRPPTDKELRNNPERICETNLVEGDGPAEQAGVQAGDILHTVNGTPCSPEVLYAAVAAAAKPGGGAMHLEVLRKGRPLTFDLHYPNQDAAIAQLRQPSAAAPSARHPVGSTIVIPDGIQSAPPAIAPTNSPQAAPSPAVHLGVHVRAVTDADATAMGLPKAQGVVVTGIEKGSLVEEMQMQVGDVVIAVNGANIADLDAFAQSVHGGAVKSFKVWRKGQALELSVPQSF